MIFDLHQDFLRISKNYRGYIHFRQQKYKQINSNHLKNLSAISVARQTCFYDATTKQPRAIY